MPRTLISDLPGGFGKSSSRLSTPGRHGARTWLLARALPPYLVLLRVGFTLPPALQPERCALTAPFHPYPGGSPSRTGEPVRRSPVALTPCGKRGSRGGIFSVALAVHEPSSSRPGRYPAHCPSEFGLSSPGRSALSREVPSSDRPVLLPAFSLSRIRIRHSSRRSHSEITGRAHTRSKNPFTALIYRLFSFLNPPGGQSCSTHSIPASCTSSISSPRDRHLLTNWLVS